MRRRVLYACPFYIYGRVVSVSGRSGHIYFIMRITSVLLFPPFHYPLPLIIFPFFILWHTGGWRTVQNYSCKSIKKFPNQFFPKTPAKTPNDQRPPQLVVQWPKIPLTLKNHGNSSFSTVANRRQVVKGPL
jgi:hypothetical protein